MNWTGGSLQRHRANNGVKRQQKEYFAKARQRQSKPTTHSEDDVPFRPSFLQTKVSDTGKSPTYKRPFTYDRAPEHNSPQPPSSRPRKAMTIDEKRRELLQEKDWMRVLPLASYKHGSSLKRPMNEDRHMSGKRRRIRPEDKLRQSNVLSVEQSAVANRRSYVTEPPASRINRANQFGAPSFANADRGYYMSGAIPPKEKSPDRSDLNVRVGYQALTGYASTLNSSADNQISSDADRTTKSPYWTRTSRSTRESATPRKVDTVDESFEPSKAASTIPSGHRSSSSVSSHLTTRYLNKHSLSKENLSLLSKDLERKQTKKNAQGAGSPEIVKEVTPTRDGSQQDGIDSAWMSPPDPDLVKTFEEHVRSPSGSWSSMLSEIPSRTSQKAFAGSEAESPGKYGDDIESSWRAFVFGHDLESNHSEQESVEPFREEFTPATKTKTSLVQEHATCNNVSIPPHDKITRVEDSRSSQKDLTNNIQRSSCKSMSESRDKPCFEVRVTGKRPSGGVMNEYDTVQDASSMTTSARILFTKLTTFNQHAQSSDWKRGENFKIQTTRLGLSTFASKTIARSTRSGKLTPDNASIVDIIED